MDNLRAMNQYCWDLLIEHVEMRFEAKLSHLLTSYLMRMGHVIIASTTVVAILMRQLIVMRVHHFILVRETSFEWLILRSSCSIAFLILSKTIWVQDRWRISSRMWHKIKKISLSLLTTSGFVVVFTILTFNFRPPYSNWCIFSTARLASSTLRNSTDLKETSLAEFCERMKPYPLPRDLPSRSKTSVYITSPTAKKRACRLRCFSQAIVPSVRNRSFRAAHLISYGILDTCTVFSHLNASETNVFASRNEAIVFVLPVFQSKFPIGIQIDHVIESIVSSTSAIIISLITIRLVRSIAVISTIVESMRSVVVSRRWSIEIPLWCWLIARRRWVAMWTSRTWPRMNSRFLMIKITAWTKSKREKNMQRWWNLVRWQFYLPRHVLLATQKMKTRLSKIKIENEIIHFFSSKFSIKIGSTESAIWKWNSFEKK